MASAILIEMDDTNTVKCPLCGVDVPIDKIDLPNRCLHPQCPLKRPGRLTRDFPGPLVVGTQTNKGDGPLMAYEVYRRFFLAKILHQPHRLI